MIAEIGIVPVPGIDPKGHRNFVRSADADRIDALREKMVYETGAGERVRANYEIGCHELNLLLTISVGMEISHHHMTNNQLHVFSDLHVFDRKVNGVVGDLFSPTS